MSPLVCPHCGCSLLEPDHVCPVELLRDPPADGSPEALWRETVFTQVGAKLKRPPHAAGHALPSRAEGRARRRGAP